MTGNQTPAGQPANNAIERELELVRNLAVYAGEVMGTADWDDHVSLARLVLTTGAGTEDTDRIAADLHSGRGSAWLREQVLSAAERDVAARQARIRVARVRAARETPIASASGPAPAQPDPPARGLDGSPGSPDPAPRPAGPSGTAAHHAQAAADNSQDGPGTTKGAGGRQPGLGTRVAVPGFGGGPPEPGPARPLDQARRLIVQAGEACTHLAAIAPDGPAAAQEATKIIGLLSQVRDLAAGQYAHDPEDTPAHGIRVARPAASPVRRPADRNSPAGQARPGRRRLCPPVPAPVQVDAIIAASLIAAAGTANPGKFPQPAR